MPATSTAETPAVDFSSLDMLGLSPNFSDQFAGDVSKLGAPIVRKLPGESVDTLIYGSNNLDMHFFDRALTAYDTLFADVPSLQGSVSDLSGTKLFDVTAKSQMRPNTDSFFVIANSSQLPSVTSIGNIYPASTIVPSDPVSAPALSVLMPDLYRPVKSLEVKGLDDHNIPVATEICQHSRFVEADIAGADEAIMPQDVRDQYNRLAQEHYCNSLSWAVTFALSNVPYDVYVQKAGSRNDEISQSMGVLLPKWVIPEDAYNKLVGISS
jgi:hypothetical protein